MDYPKVRWVNVQPFISEGREVIIMSDPEGLMEHSLVISRDVLFLLSLMDGTRTLLDIQAEYMRRFGEFLYRERLEEIVATMDQNYLLVNQNYRSRLACLQKEYETSPVRKPALAGRSYPANRMDLLMTLDEMFRDTPAASHNGELVAILSPHIDYGRGNQVYRHIYPYLRNTGKELVVIFGTCHHMTEKIWNISIKDFETPLDTVPVREELRTLLLGNDLLRDHIAEWPHRNEHSIELQLPLIQFNMPAEFEILPVLTGSMNEYIEGARTINDAPLVALASSLKKVLHDYGKPYILVAGADLAHIGAQFGDPRPLNALSLSQSKSKDEELLTFVEKVDPQAFFEAIQKERDERRICGLTPIYFLLKLVEGCTGHIVAYDQWTDGQSSVSFAGAVFYK